ncbi:MAG: hypothetical protein PHV05_04880 [Candidatus Riflebacteria bacterium]|nr:hypothetical protein [Candidatus Riflebacteria bacterium]
MQEANESTLFRQLLDRAYIRSNRSPMALAKELGISRQTIKTWLKRPETLPRNFQQIIEKLRCYVERPFISSQNPCTNSRLWQAMRCVKTFNDSELAAVANTTLNCSQQFIKALFKAGYLKKTHRERPVYQLIHDTGPKTPTLKDRRATVIDNNLGQEARWEISA